MKFNSTCGLWSLRNIEIGTWKFELLIIVLFELFKYMLVFYFTKCCVYPLIACDCV